MSLHRDHIKHGIDRAAAYLKRTVDIIADRTSESRGLLREKARHAAQKAADEMIGKGNRLRRATRSDEDRMAERMWPC